MQFIEAVDSFIDTLQNNGNYVGAVVFTAYEGSEATDANMRSGVYFNSWENGPVELHNNQGTLKNSIREASRKAQRALREENSGETDIGTAILAAEESLEAAAAQNGLPCAMFLFTDGKNSLNYPGTQAASEDNLRCAEDMILQNGTKLCGVLLNTNQSVDPSELREIVVRANGITSGNVNLGNFFIEINDPTSCSNATDQFMRLLGFSIIEVLPGESGETDIITESCDRTFRVPGVGVEEANIRIQEAGGGSIPDEVDVSITQPDGYVISGGTAAALCSTSVDRTYRIYKLSDPMPGEWTVHIEVPEGLSVEIKYNPIFSMYIAADYATSVPSNQLHANMNTEITAYLMLGGNRVTDPSSYFGYNCIFTLRSVDGTETEYPITQDGNGEYKLTIPLDYGEYYAGVKFTCDNLEADSPLRTEDFWDLKNHAPTARDMYLDLAYGFLSKSMEEYAFTNAQDVEDGADLMFTAQSSDFDVSAVAISGDTMTIDAKKVGAGSKTMTITAADSQGAETQFTVHMDVKCVTVRNIILIVAAVVILTAAAIIIIRMITRYYPDGSVILDFAVPEENGFSGVEYEIHAELTAPGNGTPRSQTLYDMLMADLNRPAGTIRSECNEKHIAPETVEQHIARLAKDLKKIKIKCVIGKDQGKRCAKIKVKGIGVVYNNSVSMTVGGFSMGFGYYPNSNDNIDDDFSGSDGFSPYYSSSSDSHNNSSAGSAPYGFGNDSYSSGSSPYGSYSGGGSGSSDDNPDLSPYGDYTSSYSGGSTDSNTSGFGYDSGDSANSDPGFTF